MYFHPGTLSGQINLLRNGQRVTPRVMVTHLTAERAGMLTGEVSLSRLLDPECEVTGYAAQDKVVLKGKFEEGREFAIAVKLIQRGGRLVKLIWPHFNGFCSYANSITVQLFQIRKSNCTYNE